MCTGKVAYAHKWVGAGTLVETIAVAGHVWPKMEIKTGKCQQLFWLLDCGGGDYRKSRISICN